MKQFGFLLLTIFFLITVSCSENAEKLIQGTWTFEKIEILNHDELIENQINFSKEKLEKDISETKKKLDETEDEITRDVLKSSLLQYETALKELPERAKEAKENTLKGFEELKGKAKLVFKEDFKYEMNLSMEEKSEGSWKIDSKENILMLIETTNNQTIERKHEIKKISKDKLIIVRVEEKQGMVMKMQMELKK